MTFGKDFASSFVKGVGRTVGALTIFGTLGLFYVAFTYTYTYKENTQKDQNTLTDQEKKIVEFDFSSHLDENKEVFNTSDSEEDLDKSVIEKKEIENYEKGELFKKLFDKIK